MRQTINLVLCLAIVAATAATGAHFLPGAWYAGLVKPAFTPPNWAFPVVWGILYLLMALAAWRITLRQGMSGRGRALAVFVLQLLFNAAWSWVFFGHHLMRVGLVDIVLLWLAILATFWLFRRIDRLAGLLLLPYLAWVTLAGCLNASLIVLNHA